MKNSEATMLLGYLAVGRVGEDFQRQTETRHFNKATGQITPLELRSVVTEGNVVLETGIALGNDSKVFVSRTPVKVQAAQIEGTDDLEFALEPVPVLAIVSVQGKITLLDLGDDGTEQALPRDAVMVGAISSPGVYRLSCFDSTIDQEVDLG